MLGSWGVSGSTVHDPLFGLKKTLSDNGLLRTLGRHTIKQAHLCHTDNMALVHIINNTNSRDSKIMTLIRKLVVKCMRFNILLEAEHVPGYQNILADKLSRLQVTAGPLGQGPARTATGSHPANQRVPSLIKLLDNSMAKSTWDNCQRTINAFNNFLEAFNLVDALQQCAGSYHQNILLSSMFLLAFELAS